MHILVKCSNANLLTQINDNGCGFNLEAVTYATEQGGHGLNNLKQRTSMLNGQLYIQACKVGQGTQVDLSIPLT